MRKKFLSIAMCLLMATGMFLVGKAQLSAETEMAANQKKEEVFVQYMDYWEYEFQVYQVNLPIQNYVSDMEQEYRRTQGIDSGTLPQDDGWNEQFESIKEELVEKQEYEIL